MAAPAPEYLFDPSDKPALPLYDVPLIVATDDSVRGYGALVEHPDDIEIEIVRWPATGWRQVDEDSGDEAGWEDWTAPLMANLLQLVHASRVVDDL